MPHIAIIGAGVRGLSSAAWLKSVGVDVTIFEKCSQLGGVWQRVHRGARVNTPSYGYTFHASNQWSSGKPSALEIRRNLEKMVQECALEPQIKYAVPVLDVQQSESGRWQINGDHPEFDGVLVATGFLGRAKEPPAELVDHFEGILRFAYQAKSSELRDRHVLVVGSGSSALDMLAMARNCDSRSATLSIHQNVNIRDISRWETLKHAIASNPLLYRLTKRPGGKPAAVRNGIRETIADPRVRIRRDGLKKISGRRATFSSGSQPVDTIIWCTGWDSGIPAWAHQQAGNPSLVIAACPSCLDTAGFGFGSATAHAKALLASLQHDLPRQFASGSSKCKCEANKTTFGLHIVLGLALYLASQKGGWKLLASQLRSGFKSNLNRFRTTDENKLASLLSFLNAPFGL